MKRKKLFYVPGLISLTGLPIILFYLRPKEMELLTVVRVYLPLDKPNADGYALSYSKATILKTIGARRIIDIPLNSFNPLFENRTLGSKLAFISKQMREMQ